MFSTNPYDFAVQKIGYFSADILSAISPAASNDIEKFYNLGIYLYKLHKPVKNYR